MGTAASPKGLILTWRESGGNAVVTLCSDLAVPIYDYVFDWQDGGFHTYRVVADATADSVLLIIDDVWDPAHLRPFTRGGPRCARLITTRDDGVLPQGARKVNVDAMQDTEADELVAKGLPDGADQKLRALAARVGNWPLLLGFVKAAVHEQMETAGQALDGAIKYVHDALDRYGLTAFDATDPHFRFHEYTNGIIDVNYNDADPTSWLWVNDFFYLTPPEPTRFCAPMVPDTVQTKTIFLSANSV